MAIRQQSEVKDKLLAIANGGWQAANINLIDKGKATPTKIKEAIDAFKAKAKSGDEFLFYYVGHGGNGSIGPGPDEELQTDPKEGSDDVVMWGQVLPGQDGVLQTEPKAGSDDN